MNSTNSPTDTLGSFGLLPEELLYSIVERCDVESKGNLYLTCRKFQNVVGECIFKEKLESFHLPVPKNIRYHAALAEHYHHFTMKFVEIFDLEPRNTGSFFTDKSLVMGQVSQEQIDQYTTNFFHVFMFLKISFPLSLIEHYDSTLRVLLESGAKFPERELSLEVENSREQVIPDLLSQALQLKCTSRTILLILDHPNQKVMWTHLYLAMLIHVYRDEVIQAILKKETENSRFFFGLDDWQPGCLVGITLSKRHLSENTKLRILEKISKVSFQQFYDALTSLSQSCVIISDELYITLLEKVEIITELEASYIVIWFLKRCSLMEKRLNQEFSSKYLGHFLDFIYRKNISISRRGFEFYSHPESPFYEQEEILNKLVRSLENPVPLDTVETAFLKKHSDSLLLQILEKGNQFEIARARWLIKLAIENNPRFSIVKKLLDIGCPVDTPTLKKALTGKYNPELQHEKSSREFPSDETIFLVLDSYLGRYESPPARISRVLYIAFKQGASDVVIKKLLRIAEGSNTLDSEAYRLFLRKARKQNRPAKIISLLEEKSPSSCIIQ